MPSDISIRKPRAKPGPYKSKPGPIGKRLGDQPRTSAQNDMKRPNLTLHDWLTVFVHMDNHPDQGQSATVAHFGSKAEGRLIFTQASLSRRLKERAILEVRAESNPTALSAKRPRVVTRPDVERALVLWIRHMEEKGETVNGPMLIAKRSRFEKELKVPEHEQLQGGGWLSSFLKT
jgi:hypothetical protein